MKKKRFKLQRVLELRERKEQAVALRLAEAQREADAARESQSAIERLRTSSTGHPGSGTGSVPTVGQLRNAAFVLEQLDRRIEAARTAVQQADAKVDSCVIDLNVASRDRRILDR